MCRKVVSTVLSLVLSVAMIVPVCAEELIEENEEIIAELEEPAVEEAVDVETANVETAFDLAELDENVEEDGDSTADGILEYSILDETAKTARIDKCVTTATGDISIPEKIGDYKVTSIKDQAFSYCRNITSINIPDSVTSIGDYAFYGCQSLASVSISKNLAVIPQKAFENCVNLTNINIPAGVTQIRRGAFMGCGLTSITVDENNATFKSENNAVITKDGTNKLVLGCKGTVIPDTVQMIGEAAFIGCTGLKEVTIPSGVTFIDSSAYEKCTSLTSINLPANVTYIGAGVFYGCEGLTSMTVEEGNTAYDSRDNCNAIIAKDGNILVAACKNTVIPNTVEGIGDAAFALCGDITSLEIPTGVKSIGEGSFQNCTGLTSLELPNTITRIGGFAFSGCDNLTSINIPSGITTISQNMFYNCSGLGSITIPAGVEIIQDRVFGYCTALSTVVIPNSVTDIGDDVFTGCTDSLTIYAYPGSTAETYANEKNIRHEPLYTVSFDTQGGSEIEAYYNLIPESAITIPSNNPTKKGYKFAGWYKEAECTTKWDFGTDKVNSNITLYAKWTANKYTNTLKYNANGGTGAPADKTVTVTYPNTQSKITVSTTKPKRTGYTFKGWYTAKTDGSKVGSTYTLGSNNKTSNQSATIYAQWSIDTYTITYKLNGGKNGKNPAGYKVTTSDITLKNPTRTGYTFKGWYTDSKLTKKITVIKKGSTGNKTVYAKWQANKYAVKFNANGGNGTMKNQSMTYDKSAKLTKNSFTRKNYTFLGWSTDKKATKAKYKNQAEVKNLSSKSGDTVTVYAIWKKK